MQSKPEVVTVASESFRSGNPKGAQMDSQHTDFVTMRSNA